MTSGTLRYSSSTVRLNGPRCAECGRPMLCGQRRQHLSCSPRCPRCYQPIQEGHACPAKKKDKDEV